MPNSGYHGLINQNFYGENRAEVFPAGERYAQKNLPSPAFWHAYIGPGHPAANHRSTNTRNKYSRHLNLSDPLSGGSALQASLGSTGGSQSGIQSNSVAPFATLTKPTCGWFFSRSTDHKKRCTGIPSADLVKWRYYVK